MRINYPDPILQFTLREEGGVSNDAGDPGGLTKWGITHITYDAWRTAKKLPKCSVRAMTKDECAEIYIENYWAAIHGDALPSGVDLVMFDDSVNSGPSHAKKLAIRIGDPTASNATTFIRAFCNARLSFLRSLSTWKRFGKGWGARVGRCEALALRMAAGIPISVKPAASSPTPNSNSLSGAITQQNVHAQISTSMVQAKAQAKRSSNGAVVSSAGATVASASTTNVPADHHWLLWIGVTICVGLIIALIGVYLRQSGRAFALETALKEIA